MTGMTTAELGRLRAHVRAIDEYEAEHERQRARNYADVDAWQQTLRARWRDSPQRGHADPILPAGVRVGSPGYEVTAEEQERAERIGREAEDRMRAWERANKPDVRPWDTPAKVAAFIDAKLLRGSDGWAVAVEKDQAARAGHLAKVLGRPGRATGHVAGDRLLDALVIARRRVLAFASIVPSVVEMAMLTTPAASRQDAEMALDRIGAWCNATTREPAEGPTPSVVEKARPGARPRRTMAALAGQIKDHKSQHPDLTEAELARLIGMNPSAFGRRLRDDGTLRKLFDSLGAGSKGKHAAMTPPPRRSPSRQKVAEESDRD